MEYKYALHWMRVNASEYETCTELAEACCDEFDENELLDDPDHWVWDIALDAMQGDKK